MRFFILLLFFFLASPLFAEAPNEYLGPTDILVGSDSDVLYILERDARQIRKVDVNGSKQPEILPLPIEPERMRWFPGKSRLAVVGGGPCGRLLVVETEPMKILADIPVGHTPSDVAIFRHHEPGNTTFYVANRFDGDISVVELSKEKLIGRETRRIPAGREPIALTVTPNGRTLIVANFLPEDSAIDFNIACRVRFIDTSSGEITALRLDSGAINLRDVLLDPEGRYLYVTGGNGHFQHVPNDVSGGWMNEYPVYVLDVAKQKVALTYYLDDYAIGSANLHGISLSDDGCFLVVASAGTGDVILINRQKLLDSIKEPDAQRYSAELPGDVQIANGADPGSTAKRLPERMRIPTAMKGVRHAVMTKNGIFATAYFDDTVMKIIPVFSEKINFSTGILPKDLLTLPRKTNHRLRTETYSPIWNNALPSARLEIEKMLESVEIAKNAPLRFLPLPAFNLAQGLRFERSFARLGPEPKWTDVRFGEIVFHDATLCKEHWQSCVTCHPEGRSDGLNWDLLNDGQDNPKSSKSMLLAHETPPSMAHGVRDRAESAVRKGFETILMISAPESEAVAVDAYLSRLQPVPSPYLVFDRTKTDCRGTLSESAKRGKRIFNSERSGCSTCHPEPLFTDLRLHDVGTQSVLDFSPMFDTPTLVEVWRTAPYLHDGRYTTIRELIVDGKHVNTDGRLDRLTPQEIDDLIEYVLSL